MIGKLAMARLRLVLLAWVTGLLGGSGLVWADWNSGSTTIPDGPSPAPIEPSMFDSGTYLHCFGRSDCLQEASGSSSCGGRPPGYPAPGSPAPGGSPGPVGKCAIGCSSNPTIFDPTSNPLFPMGPANPSSPTCPTGNCCPKQFGTSDLSVVNNTFYNFHHDALDLPSIGGSAVEVTRYHSTRDFFAAGSFGRGIFCTFDIRLRLGIDTDRSGPDVERGYVTGGSDLNSTRDVHIRLPQTGAAISFDYDKDAQEDNTYKPVKEFLCRPLEILDAQKNPATRTGPLSPVPQYVPEMFADVAWFADAKYARLTNWDGRTFLFELVQAETISGWNANDHHPVNGRLVEYRTPQGDGYDISYQSWTAAEIASSPSRQWQMDTVTDIRTGRTLTFTYHPQQQLTCWVVSQISDSAGGVVQYGYAGGTLSTINHPTGETSTFEYSLVGGSKIKLEMHDLSAAPRHRHKQVYMGGGVSTVNGEVMPTSVGMSTGVVNGEGEVSYAMLNGGARTGNAESGAGSFYGTVYTGGGRIHLELTRRSGPANPYSGWAGYWAPRWYLEDGWSMSTQGGYNTVTGSLEPAPYGYNGPLEVVMTGRHSGVITPDDRLVEYQYDDRGNRIYAHYSDGTIEAHCYNDFNQPLRSRDRNGHVTQFTYDAKGRLLSRSEGWKDAANNTPTVDPTSGELVYDRCADNDVQTSEHAVWQWTYHLDDDPEDNEGWGRVATATDPRGNVTSYAYDSLGRIVTRTDPPLANGDAVVTSYTYDSAGRPQSVTDPLGHSTSFIYDARHRLVATYYHDGTSLKYEYGTSGSETGLLARIVGRDNVVTQLSYDGSDRMVQRIEASALIQANGTETPTPDAAKTTQFAYVNGTNDIRQVSSDGQTTQYVYDYRGRRVRTGRLIGDNERLVDQSVYVGDQLFSHEDPYGRKTFYSYDPVDGRMVRSITGTVPEYDIAATDPSDPNYDPFLAVSNVARDTATANVDFLVSEREHDPVGNLTASVDARGIRSERQYDSRNRVVVNLEAVGSPAERRTETIYDAVSNVTEVRSPRYFDAGDVAGNQVARDIWTYTARNLVATHTEAFGSAEEASEAFDYDALGRRLKRTSFDGEDWETDHEDCCGNVVGQINPLGHGTITRKDPLGRTVHRVEVADYADHAANLEDPVDAKTLGESTIRYDGRGRVIAQTSWMVPRGSFSVADPPIAGWGTVPSVDGLTTQYLYDTDLTDGVGLDDGSGAAPPLSGTPAISLAAAISQLALPEAAGGANWTFNSAAPGQAKVTINPEGETRFAIQDSAGRSLMMGVIDPSDGSLITWNCQVHDGTEVVGGQTLLASQTVDALGRVGKQLSDGAGRTIQSIDALGKVTTSTYDAGGNRLSVRDPNGVGQDCTYDALGRDVSCTDTAGVTTSQTYDRAGNKISSTDGKGETTTYVFDARGRQIKQIDRLGGQTEFAYDAAGRLLSLTDAEDQVTSYAYDAIGTKLAEIYPDHVPGSAIGDAGYGIVSFTSDAAGRTLVRTDQQGDTCTFAYDLAGRLESKTYAGHVSGPLAGEGHSDTYTYDASGKMLTAVSGRYNNTVTYTYDAAGRKATESLTTGGRTYDLLAHYDALGRLASLEYPNGSIAERDYDERGQLSELTYQNDVINTRSYDDGGRLVTNAFGNGVSEARSFNNDNTLAGIAYSGGSNGAIIGDVTYGWDVNKNKTSETIAGTMSGYGFDVGAAGYDQEDRLVSWNRSDNQLDQSWNLSLVGDWDSFTENGTAQTRNHGPTHELQTVASEAFNHDAKGNQTLIPAVLRSDSDPLSMRWDFENKLVEASFSDPLASATVMIDNGDPGYVETGTFHGSGLTGINGSSTRYGVAGASVSWTPPSLPAGSYRVWIFNVTHSFATSTAQVDVVHSGQTATSVLDQRHTGQPGWVDLGEYTFDGSGNEYVQLTNTSTNSVIRSDAVRFVPAQSVSYQWDALGRRVGREEGSSTVTYVQWGQQTVGDYSDGVALHHFIYGSYIDEPVLRTGSGPKYYFHHNQQYSVVALTDFIGRVKERYAYDAYGRPTIMDREGVVLASTATGNRQLYTGREYDPEIGLYHYRARMYDPNAGRFCSRDPIGYRGSEWNLFEYVDSQPTLLLDPTGKNHVLNEARRKCRTPFPNLQHKPTANGCSSPIGSNFPGFTFIPACNTHDYCYGRCGSDKSQCDSNFYDDMLSVCENSNLGTLDYITCKVAALDYYLAVSVAGGAYWEAGQDASCLWQQTCECNKLRRLALTW